MVEKVIVEAPAETPADVEAARAAASANAAAEAAAAATAMASVGAARLADDAASRMAVFEGQVQEWSNVAKTHSDSLNSLTQRTQENERRQNETLTLLQSIQAKLQPPPDPAPPNPASDPPAGDPPPATAAAAEPSQPAKRRAHRWI